MNKITRRDHSSAYPEPAENPEQWADIASAGTDFNTGARRAARLKRVRWTILGVDAGSHRGRAYVDVYAFDKALFSINSHNELKGSRGAKASPTPSTL